MTREELVFITSAAKLADEAARADYNKFTTTNKRSEKLGKVKDFQSAEGQLTADGKWGPNTAAAARYYLNKPVTPAIWSATSKITWKPPTVESEKKLAEKMKVKPTPKAKEVIKRKKDTPPPKKKVKTSKAQEKANREADDVRKQLFKAAKLDMPTLGQEKVLRTNKIDAEDAVAKAAGKQVSKAIDGDLKEIKKLLQKQAVSKQATNEHKKIVSNTAFEKDIKDSLKTITSLLKTMPAGPERQKTVTIGRRFLGLLLT